MSRYLEERDRQQAFRAGAAEPRRIEGTEPRTQDKVWAELMSATSVGAVFTPLGPALMVKGQQARWLDGKDGCGGGVSERLVFGWPAMDWEGGPMLVLEIFRKPLAMHVRRFKLR